MRKSAEKMKKIPWLAIGIFAMFLLVVLLIVHVRQNNQQALGATGADIYFEGEYSIDGGEWQKIEKGKHIPSTRGDVTLRGYFQMATPDGTYIGTARAGIPIALFLDHVSVKIYESGQQPYTMFNEHPAVGVSGCGEIWLSFALRGDGSEPVEIVIHNPHSFGNETAVDEFVSGIAMWTGTDFEGEVMARGDNQRYLGLLLCIGSIVLLGIALFSTLIHVPKSTHIWLFGFVTFFAGVYLTYSASGTYFWSERIGINTTVIGASMMYYMLFVSAIIAVFASKTTAITRTLTALLGVFDAVCLFLPLVSSVHFYDTWAIWSAVQSAVNLVLLGCIVREFISANWKMRCAQLAMTLPLIAFWVDVIATMNGVWKGGAVSKYVFAGLFVSLLAIVLFVIPQNILAVRRARDLELQRSRLELEKNAIEAELRDSRISIMLSQIRPHFIYNTLGTIERLCLKDPQMAFELVRNFSLYLRGNFSELDSVAPIRFSEEMKHVHHYVNIEQVRFPDMTIVYQLEFSDFVLPALSVQPLVENAIKHGLMPLETGGRVVIRSYETDTHYCVEVTDNGAGFDTSVSIDKKDHVGLQNIRERLAAIVNGELIVESEIGKGTRATIKIPKEGKV